MGNSKVKTKPSAETIYPWLIYTEPSVQDPRLVRLCLSHQESNHFSILETYYPDEIEAAVSVAIAAVQRRKHMLTFDILEVRDPQILLEKLSKFLPVSRSTTEFAAECFKKAPKGFIVRSLLGGCRPLEKLGSR